MEKRWLSEEKWNVFQEFNKIVVSYNKNKFHKTKCLNCPNNFNNIWGKKSGLSIFRKVTKSNE